MANRSRMPERLPRKAVVAAGRLAPLLVALWLCGLSGCHTLWQRNRFLQQSLGGDSPIPHELAMTTMPTYRIEPPDILLVDAVRIVPKEPYQIEPLDLLTILVEGTPPESPILGEFRVDPSGTVILGPGYGRVTVEGLTLEQARQKIEQHLSTILAAPEVAVSLAEPAARQQIEGQHLVSQDGTISLGTYGTVRVVGMTVEQAKAAIEERLSQFLEDPKIALDVSVYNSKVYYLILQGAGQGDLITRLPISGNETVLDVLSQIDGLTVNQSTNIWIARPAPAEMECDQILPVDWNGLIEGGMTATNYQILPGDRIFVGEDKFTAFTAFIDRITAPFERLFGVTLLGTQTVQAINRSPTGFRGSPRGLNPSILLQ
jgi:polysaccharide export outer membrane protein